MQIDYAKIFLPVVKIKRSPKASHRLALGLAITKQSDI